MTSWFFIEMAAKSALICSLALLLAMALKQMVRTFFDGSAANAATALLGLTRSLSPDEAAALQKAIEQAKERE